MSTTYAYLPLPEDRIRLFALHPAISEDEPLECSIYLPKRCKAGAYEAVSYVWSSKDQKTLWPLKVRCSEEGNYNGDKNFFIWPNLASALKRFRSKHEDRVLWSDAICIDQSSDIEKSKQVPMMETTYSQAQRVLVWLGEKTETSSVAINFMHTVINQVIDIDKLVKDNADQWDALESLLRMPWFTRRWIVQEIALAREASVYCGGDEIRWTDFCDCVEFFQEHYSDIKETFLKKDYGFSRNRLGEVKALGACRLVRITSNLFHKSADGAIQRRLCTLESLVGSLTPFNATNPRDIIYAMVAISKDIKTTNQKARTVAYDAQPVMTPPHVRDNDWADSDDGQRPSKKRKRTRASSVSVRLHWQEAAQQIMNQLPSHEEPRHAHPSRRGKPTLEGVLEELVSNRAPEFVVDYRRSFLRVCMDFVAFSILQSGSLDVLCRPWVPAEPENNDKLDLPSWLMSTDRCPYRPRPDGTFVRINGDPLVGENAMELKRYSAAGAHSRAWRVTKERAHDGWGFGFFDRPSIFHDGPHQHRSLFVSGFVINTILEIKDKAEDATIPSEWFGFTGWHDRSQLPPDHLWRTLVADRRHDGEHVEAFFKRAIRDLVHRHGTSHSAFNVKDIMATPQCNKHSEKVLERILAVVPNRRLFKIKTATSGELFGLAPAGARYDDLVCILYGCTVPVILRRRQVKYKGKDVEYFELVGDAYLHGMMGGEALEEQEKQNIPSQQFELR